MKRTILFIALLLAGQAAQAQTAHSRGVDIGGGHNEAGTIGGAAGGASIGTDGDIGTDGNVTAEGLLTMGTGSTVITNADGTIRGAAIESAIAGTGITYTAGVLSADLAPGGVDISDDTNLAAGDGLTLTGDSMAVDSTVARNNAAETFTSTVEVQGNLTIGADLLADGAANNLKFDNPYSSGNTFISIEATGAGATDDATLRIFRNGTPGTTGNRQVILYNGGSTPQIQLNALDGGIELAGELKLSGSSEKITLVDGAGDGSVFMSSGFLNLEGFSGLALGANGTIEAYMTSANFRPNGDGGLNLGQNTTQNRWANLYLTANVYADAIELGDGSVGVTSSTSSISIDDTHGGAISIDVPTAGNRSIWFADQTETDAGQIQYQESTKRFTLGTKVTGGNFEFRSGDNAVALTLESDQDALFEEDVTVDGFVAHGSAFTSSLSIVTGAVTATRSIHTVDTEGDMGSDNLDTINGGVDGAVLYLRAQSGARTVTLTESGNLKLSSATFDLDHAQDYIQLIYDSAIGGWCEISRSDNG